MVFLMECDGYPIVWRLWFDEPPCHLSLSTSLIITNSKKNGVFCDGFAICNSDLRTE